VLESTSVSYRKVTLYVPVLDLLRGYAYLDERDDPYTIRAKVTGRLRTLDESLQDAIPPLLASLDALPDDSPFPALDTPQRRQRTLTAQKRVLLCESRAQPVLLILRICTGSIPSPRRCWRAWSRASPRPDCCAWSPTGRTVSTAGCPAWTPWLTC
jgi:hypothetical protein